MNKEFCIACGHKNIFESSRPKFCAGCGLALNTSNVSHVIKASQLKARRPDEESERESDLSLDELDLDAMRKQVAVNTEKNIVTLDDLWKAPAPREPSYRAASRDPVGQAILDQTIKECAPSKEPKIIEAANE